jgi:hypothetical protein
MAVIGRNFQLNVSIIVQTKLISSCVVHLNCVLTFALQVSSLHSLEIVISEMLVSRIVIVRGNSVPIGQGKFATE